MDGYPLRPELLESVYHLFAVTRDVSLLKIALRAQQALRKTRVPCGFCSVHGVLSQQHVLLDQVGINFFFLWFLFVSPFFRWTVSL
jgi:hypothetical protein